MCQTCRQDPPRGAPFSSKSRTGFSSLGTGCHSGLTASNAAHQGRARLSEGLRVEGMGRKGRNGTGRRKCEREAGRKEGKMERWKCASVGAEGKEWLDAGGEWTVGMSKCGRAGHVDIGGHEVSPGEQRVWTEGVQGNGRGERLKARASAGKRREWTARSRRIRAAGHGKGWWSRARVSEQEIWTAGDGRKQAVDCGADSRCDGEMGGKRACGDQCVGGHEGKDDGRVQTADGRGWANGVCGRRREWRKMGADKNDGTMGMGGRSASTMSTVGRGRKRVEVRQMVWTEGRMEIGGDKGWWTGVSANRGRGRQGRGRGEWVRQHPKRPEHESAAKKDGI
eukprot:s1166_g14.t1